MAMLDGSGEALCSLIERAAECGVLKKAVFSKPSDAAIKKTVLSVKNISGRDMLQA